MQKMGIVVSTIHAAIKFQTPFGIGTVFSSYNAKKPTDLGTKVKQIMEEPPKDVLSCTDAEERILVNDLYPDQMVVIGKQLPASFKADLEKLLRANADVFAWTYSDMTGVPRTLIIDGKPFGTEHKLNEFKHIEPIKENRQSLAPESLNGKLAALSRFLSKGAERSLSFFKTLKGCTNKKTF